MKLRTTVLIHPDVRSSFPLFLFSQEIRAVSPEVLKSLSEKLERWDVEEAWSEVKDLLTQEPKDPKLLELAAHIAFYRGDYQESLKLMKSASNWRKKRSERVLSSFSRGRLGSPSRLNGTRVPISPSASMRNRMVSLPITSWMPWRRPTVSWQSTMGLTPGRRSGSRSFPIQRHSIYASSLSARDIEVTGAVGIAQFNKLMVLSPRSLVHGYRWLDAISHEYMHYLIIKLTANKAPIWFHEGLAKYDETRWRNGSSYLSPLYETLALPGPGRRAADQV